MQDGTLTATSLGVFGVDAFTPIINLPQSEILDVRRIVRKPVVVHRGIAYAVLEFHFQSPSQRV